MKASALLRLLACVSFLVAARYAHLAYDENNRVRLIGVAVSGVAGVIFLIQASNCSERKL
jgi:hypothetical protein